MMAIISPIPIFEQKTGQPIHYTGELRRAEELLFYEKVGSEFPKRWVL